MLPVVALLGCTARDVTVTSDPAGADIFIDARPIGTAPVRSSVRGRWVYQGEGARHVVTARAPGMQSGLYYLEPTETFVPGAIACIVLLGAGCPWAAQIPGEVNVRLHPVEEQ
jgi:PEGA domain